MFLLEVIAGWLLADFLSGVFHAIGDSETLGNSRVVKFIVASNGSHHEKPYAIVTQPFIERNMTFWLGTIMVAVPWYYFFSGSWMLASMVTGGILSAEVHRWAHAPSKAPWWVRRMQKAGVFMSPKHHALHHRPPHGVRFCILTDYVNPMLDWVVEKARKMLFLR